MPFKFRKIDSPSCYFCEDEPETLEHFFFYCSKVRARAFWEEVNLLLNSQGMICRSFRIVRMCRSFRIVRMCRSFNFRDIVFGVLDTVSYEILLNYIVLENSLSIALN